MEQGGEGGVEAVADPPAQQDFAQEDEYRNGRERVVAEHVPYRRHGERCQAASLEMQDNEAGEADRGAQKGAASQGDRKGSDDD